MLLDETEDNHEVTVRVNGELAGGIGTDGSLEESIRFGETTAFEVDATIPGGETATLTLGDFRVREFASGTGVDMDDERLTFTLEYADGSSQQFTIRPGTPGSGGSGTGSETFQVTDVGLTETVTREDEVRVSATVTNTGDTTDTVELSYQVADGDVTRSLGDMTLDPGASKVVERTFEGLPAELAAGTYRQEVAAPQDSAGESLTVEKSGPIEVRVITVTGESVEDPTVRVEHESGTTYTATNRSDGTYVVDEDGGLPTGKYTIVAGHSEYSSRELTVDGSKDGTTVSAKFSLSEQSGGVDSGWILRVGLGSILVLFLVVLVVVAVSRFDLWPGSDAEDDRGGVSLRDDPERSPLLEDLGSSRLRRPWLPASVRESFGSLFDRDDGDSGRN